jgi:hypothetical protein
MARTGGRVDHRSTASNTSDAARPDLRRLERVAAQLHEALAEGSVRHRTSCFSVFVWPTPDPFYRNVAVPTAVPADWRPALLELLACFARVRRPPRLEFSSELWPGLLEALPSVGLAPHAKAQVMAASGLASEAAATPGASPVRLLHVADSLDLLAHAIGSAGMAFGEQAQAPADEVRTLRSRLGSRFVRAAVVMEGKTALAGAHLVGRADVAELAGVWTRADRRRSGLALRACATLLEPFFARGGELVWLSSEEPFAQALYARLGFTAIGTQLDVSGAALDPQGSAT